jgi:hypothetical protein
MPISRADLPHIADRMRDLLHRLEGLPNALQTLADAKAKGQWDPTKPNPRGCIVGKPRDALEQVRERLLAALTPSMDQATGDQFRRGGDADIAGSTLDPNQRKILRDLWRLLGPQKWYMVAEDLRDEAIVNLQAWLQEIDAALPTGQTQAAQQGPPTAWYHCGLSYSTDRISPIQVSHEQHNALNGFLDGNEALDTQKLESNGVSNVSKVMKKLAQLFPGAVRRPSAKGEGYYIRVRTVGQTPTR